jgi:hypothetical protein
MTILRNHWILSFQHEGKDMCKKKLTEECRYSEPSQNISGQIKQIRVDKWENKSKSLKHNDLVILQ